MSTPPTASDLPQRKRRLQLSLRMLLLMVCLSSLLVAFFGYYWNRSQHESKILDRLGNRIDKVVYDYQLAPDGKLALDESDTDRKQISDREAPGPKFLRRWFGDKLFASVVHLSLNGNLETEETLALSKLSGLKHLKLFQNHNLNSLECLSSVDLDSLSLSDCPKLVKIQLADGPRLQDLAIKNCEKLELIELGGQDSDPSGVGQLKIWGCDRVREIRAGSKSNLRLLQIDTADSLEKIGPFENFQRLESLQIQSDARSQNHPLQRLDFSSTIPLVSIRVALPGLKEFRSDGLTQLDELLLHTRETDTDFDFSGCQNLRSLEIISSPNRKNIQGPRCSVSGLDVIDQLEKIVFHNVRSKAISELSDHSKLQDLELELCDVSSLTGLSSLRRVMMSACSIENLDALKESKKIEILELGFCAGLKDITEFIQLPTLKVLHVEYCEPLSPICFDRRKGQQAGKATRKSSNFGYSY